MKLFCFPYAGGSAAIFSKWNMLLGPDIEVRAIELPGRGKRFQEPNVASFDAAVNDIWEQIVNEIREQDYAFFGHSLGAKIAFALSLRVCNEKLRPARHSFFSGRGAPNVPGKDEKIYSKMSDIEFKEEIFNLGGTPKEFFDSPELLDVFFPILRNDFRLAEGEEDDEKQFRPLSWDISIFVGKEESLTSDQVVGWKDVTTGNCSIHFFNGGHFFLNDETQGVISRINQVMSQTQWSERRLSR
jgi:medium-chain acyl-[acyl-carrier-protein] hydrolase